MGGFAMQRQCIPPILSFPRKGGRDPRSVSRLGTNVRGSLNALVCVQGPLNAERGSPSTHEVHSAARHLGEGAAAKATSGCTSSSTTATASARRVERGDGARCSAATARTGPTRFAAVARGGRPAEDRARAARRRGRRRAARRPHELPGAAELRSPARARRPPRLLRLRPAAPRRRGPRRPAARAAQGAAAAACSAAQAGVLRYSDHVVGDGARVFAEACRHGARGHRVEARAICPYQPGRGPTLAEDEVHPAPGVRDRRLHRSGGFARRHSARCCSASTTTTAGSSSPARSAPASRRQSARDLRQRLETLAQREPPFAPAPRGRQVRNAHWVRPTLVAEVAFTEWTERRQDPPSVVPGAARRQASGRGRPRAAAGGPCGRSRRRPAGRARRSAPGRKARPPARQPRARAAAREGAGRGGRGRQDHPSGPRPLSGHRLDQTSNWRAFYEAIARLDPAARRRTVR